MSDRVVLGATIERLRGRVTEGREIRVGTDGLLFPASCSCCGEPAGVSRRETRSGDRLAVIVPYCSACLKHASSASTHVLSVALASALLGMAATAGLPLAWPELSFVGFVPLAVSFGLLPVGFAALWRRSRASGHAAITRAAWFTRSGRLFLVSSRFASELADANGLDAEPARGREPWLSPWMANGALLAFIAAPSLYYLHHPTLRIVNLTPHRIEVFVDDRGVAELGPSTAESPAAGVEIRVASGRRKIQARAASGEVVHLDVADVVSGAAHLYAPGAVGVCFWLETTAYGRHGQHRSVAPLEPERRFWVLSERVDTWFSPNPPPEELDARSSGGTLTALRQAPCVEAPNPVRRASTLHE